MTSCPGCPGVSRSLSTARPPPRTRQGVHIVLIKFYSNAKELHIATFKEDHADEAREYMGHIKECEAAIEAGDLPPVIMEEVEACIVEVNVICRATVQRLVAQLAIDEIPPGYFNGLCDFLSECASDASGESELAEELDSRLQWLDRYHISSQPSPRSSSARRSPSSPDSAAV